MPLIAGTCVIAPGPVVTGFGLAKAIADALAAPLPAGSTTTESAMQSFANNLAAAIVEHIVTNATVTVVAGIPVATAGTAAAQTGATVGPGTGTVL